LTLRSSAAQYSLPNKAQGQITHVASPETMKFSAGQVLKERPTLVPRADER
jgi:hypothetical protein